MKKKTVLYPVLAICGLSILFGNAGNTTSDNNTIKTNDEKEDTVKVKNEKSNTNKTEHTKEVKKKTCDGTTIYSDCIKDGVEYTTYRYYPPVPEKSHVEEVTTYSTEVVGYCTLCNDGTRSPSCSTGRGTCSHHGGVAQWNAPIYREVPHTEQQTIIDSPAEPERWEIIPKTQ